MSPPHEVVDEAPSKSSKGSSDDEPPESPIEFCPCENIYGGVKYTFAQIQLAASKACLICSVYERVITAIVDGCLPAMFPGARDEAQKEDLLNELKVTATNGTCGLILYMKGSQVRVGLFEGPEGNSGDGLLGLSCDNLYLPPTIEFGPLTDSDRGFARARHWLQECLDHHDCSAGVSSTPPRRLLHVPDGGHIRLIETDRDFKEPYVCLSHRWGDATHPRLITTTENYQNHTQRLAWKDIPKTFRDAVIICQKLSVRYLWIDSLCILQEFAGMSEEQERITKTDFAAENSDMARIYRNSYLTICASLSKSMNSGIFSTKPYGCHQIRGIDKKGREYNLRIRERTSHWTPPTDLESRAWAFQEYLLPPRVLEFGQFDLTWKCKNSYVCECRGSLQSGCWRKLVAEELRPPQNPAEAENWWENILCYYVKKHLSKEKDKLPALSGLAQIYHSLTNDVYLAGLWKASLPHVLCWYHIEGTGTLPLPLTIGKRKRLQEANGALSRAPSWSWASLDFMNDAECHFWLPGQAPQWHELSQRKSHMRVVCTVHNAVCQPSTADPFGETDGGFIELGVRVIPATISTASHDSMIKPIRGEIAWSLSCVKEEDIRVLICFADCCLEDDDLEVGDKVYCAPILENLSEPMSERGCLVLKRTLESNSYRRIGFCIMRKENPNFDWKGGWNNDRDWHPSQWVYPDLTRPEYTAQIMSYASPCGIGVESRIRII